MPPRQLAAKDDRHSTPGLASSSTIDKPSKRKAVSSACVPCRRRKSKCDGGQPACSTCLAVYRTDCTYDAEPEQRRKSGVRKPLQNIQTRSDPSSLSSSADVLVASLRNLPENEAVSLFHQIRTQDRIEELASSISRRVSINQESSNFSFDSSLTSPTPSCTSSFQRDAFPLPTRSTSPGPSADRSWHDGLIEPRTRQNSAQTWFRTPQDVEFVDRLLSLYFAWHHPFHTVFSGPHFMHDYQKGLSNYCSSLLLYAVLSLGCNYVDRSDPSVDAAQYDTMGQLYFTEAQNILEATHEADVTTVQALAVMALREAACGHEWLGYRYLGRAVRMAMELNLHLSTHSGGERELPLLDVEIRKVTFWALHNLETMNALLMGRVSGIPVHAIDVEKPSNADKMDSLIYQPYEDVNQAVEPAAHHAMHCILFTTQFGELCQLINDTNLTLYAPQEHFTIQRLQGAHSRYQAWYNNIPEVFLLQNTSMPQVVLLHISYYKALMHLFLPFFKLDLSQAGLDPQAICTYCACEISNLLDRIRVAFGIQKTCVAVLGSIYSAASVHLLSMPDPTATMRLTQALNDLRTLNANFALAGRCIDRLRILSHTWNIPLPEAAGIPPLNQVEQTTNNAVLGTFRTRASLSEDLKERVIPTTGPYRNRFDSASGGVAPFGQYQDHTQAMPHPIMPPEQQQQMMWSAYPHQEGVQMQPEMPGIPEAAPAYSPYQGQP